MPSRRATSPISAGGPKAALADADRTSSTDRGALALSIGAGVRLLSAVVSGLPAPPPALVREAVA